MTARRRSERKNLSGTNFTIQKVKDAVWHLSESKRHMACALYLLLPGQSEPTRWQRYTMLRATSGDVADSLTLLDGHVDRITDRLFDAARSSGVSLERADG